MDGWTVLIDFRPPAPPVAVPYVLRPVNFKFQTNGRYFQKLQKRYLEVIVHRDSGCWLSPPTLTKTAIAILLTNRKRPPTND